jgi:uncharacterized membrane protein YhiD involved in acid resistance
LDRESIKQLIELLRLDADRTEVLGHWEVMLALALSLLCSVVVARLYRYTHQAPGYSQSFTQTLVLTSLVTTLIMIVIGSNIARAFSLVGALSIIRFRNAVKETRDVGYIFFAMAIAMAAGTRFYGVALLATAFIACVMLAFSLLDFGASREGSERILRVDLPPGSEVEATLGETLRRLFSSYHLLRLETVKDGLQARATLSVRPKPNTTGAVVLAEMAKANEGLKVAYESQQHGLDP